MASKQALTPHLVKRGQTFYFRIAVPKDLRADFKHQEIKRSLRTTDLPSAIQIASAYEAEVQRQFALLRSQRLAVRCISSSHQDQPAAHSTQPKTIITLENALTSFIKEKRASWSDRVARETPALLETLKKAIGPSTDISIITRADIVEIREKLTQGYGAKKGRYQGQPRSVATVNKYIGILVSFFKWCILNGHLDSNPATGLQLKQTVKTTEERKAYSQHQLQALFNKLPSPESEHPERWWIPLIALYSGLRLEEICSLKVEDIVVEDSVLCFKVNGKHLKTAAAARMIPVHTTLLDLGFRSYLATIKDEYLFPELTVDKYGRRGKEFSKWFGRHLRVNVKIADRQITFHSLRHSFATALKHARTDHPMISELMGHSISSQTFGRYAKGYPPSMLFEAVTRVTYDINFG